MAAALSRQAEELAEIEVQLEQVEIRRLQSGDHIAVKDKFLFMKYYHHGIFIGHEEGVIDFGQPKKKLKPTVKLIDISTFVAGRALMRVVYPTGTCNSPKTTVCLAQEVEQDPSIWGEYDVKFNNCEHFAMKCKTGKHVSRQSVKAMRNLLKRTSINIASAASSGLYLSAQKKSVK